MVASPHLLGFESRRKQNTSRLASCIGAQRADQRPAACCTALHRPARERILTMSVFVMP